MVNSSLFLLLLNLTMHHEIGSSLFFLRDLLFCFRSKLWDIYHMMEMGTTGRAGLEKNLYYNKM